MRKYLFIICLLYSGICYGQAFDRFAFESPVTRLTMDEYGNTYVLFKNYMDCISITKMDQNNQMVWTKNFYDFFIYNEHPPGTQLLAKDGRLYFTYCENMIGFTRSGIVQFDYNGNVIWDQAKYASWTAYLGGPIKI